MSVDDLLPDLHIVLAADIFYVDAQTKRLEVKERFDAIPAIAAMKALLHRDKETIRRARDPMNNRYRIALRQWSTYAGNYLHGDVDVDRFNTAYEQLLAYYAGRAVDEMLLAKKDSYDVPPLIVAAYNRFWKEMGEKVSSGQPHPLAIQGQTSERKPIDNSPTLPA